MFYKGTQALFVIGMGVALAQYPDGLIAEETAKQAADSSQKPKISLAAGHNVVDAVDDVRETIADLAQAIEEGREGFGYGDWEDAQGKLAGIIEESEQMEQRLDKKADNTDSSWLNWLADRDYSVSVKSEIGALGSQLNTIGKILADEKSKPSIPLVVGHNVIGQVDDVRETTDDLLSAISDAGPKLGWFDEEAQKQFPSYISKLEAMEKILDEKAGQADDEWSIWVTNPEFRVFVHDQVNTLSNMLTEVSDRITLPKKATAE